MQQSPLGSRRLNFNQIIKARSQCLGTGMTPVALRHTAAVSLSIDPANK
ncbi:hypothetical protein [Wolbachia endosymbiont (group A) of Rhinocyllus conicus]|nr:hypothetical protein [Wolbachia endosymbiont (group A) of Rhinocyllus conicus]